MGDWVYLVHEETGGSTRVPDVPDVIAMHESRGWTVAVEPAEDVRVVAVPPSGEEWVEMTHPDLPHALPHRVPNHPDAIAGMRESGWELARRVEAGGSGEAGETAAAKRRKQTPADAGKDNHAAGDGSDEKE